MNFFFRIYSPYHMNKPTPIEQKFQKISKLGFFSGPIVPLFCLNELDW